MRTLRANCRVEGGGLVHLAAQVHARDAKGDGNRAAGAVSIYKSWASPLSISKRFDNLSNCAVGGDLVDLGVQVDAGDEREDPKEPGAPAAGAPREVVGEELPAQPALADTCGRHSIVR